jgi:hypothetical protein
MQTIIPVDTASGVLDVSQEKAIQPIMPLDTTIGDFKSLINPAQEFLSAPETITYPGSGLVFVNNYRVGDVIDAGELQYAQEYREAIIKAEHELQSHFANPITVNLSFKLQTIPDTDSQGNYTVAAENSHDSVKVSYNELKQALLAHATTSDQLAAVSSLATADPSGGIKIVSFSPLTVQPVMFELSPAMARMLGITQTVPTDGDGEITLNDGMWLQWVEKNFNSDLDYLNFSGDDVVGTLEHEISEVMGRFSQLGVTHYGNGQPDYNWAPLDLFRYSATGGALNPMPARDYTGGGDGRPSYFSIDGIHLLSQFHNSVRTDGTFDGTDLGDWDSSVKNDPFGKVGPGLIDTLSDTDLRVMEILGWNPRVVNGLDQLTHTGDSVKDVASNVLSQMDNLNVSTMMDARPSIELPPEVAVNDVTAVHGQSIAAWYLFTASDPNGDAISKCAFWNSGTGGGHFVLDGVVQGTNQEIDVDAAQLSRLSYQSGSGADTLWVRAYDGTQWSPWSNSFTVTAPIDSAPVETAANIVLGKDQTAVAGVDLFTTSDADGDPVAQFAFWNTGAGGGHFSINGFAQAAGQEIDVDASQHSQLAYQAGSASDTLWVRANDGYVWGSWSQSFTVSAFVDTAPAVSVANLNAAHGQSFAAADLFSASDADGDSISKYAFWNSGTGGGHFMLDGVVQGSGREIDATAAQLSQLSYQSGSGADTLWVRVNDGTQWSNWSSSFTVMAPIDAAPTVTVSNVNAAHGDIFAAADLFSASDADGDSISKYAFWNSGTGGGHFMLDGAVQRSGQEIDVSAAQLSQLGYQSGSGADTLWVRVNDGTQWSNWSGSFTVTAPIDAAPTVSVANVSAAHGQSFAAADLFSASDADGDSISKYAFWNSGTGGGQFMLDGAVQRSGQEIDVSAAQLSQLSYQSGSGADTLWARVNDGTQWSNWSGSFTVTAPIDTGAVVTPASPSISSFAGQNFAASSLFTYSDPFGSPAVQYDLWNSGGGGGHFVLNGTSLPANQDNVVYADKLGELSYQVGNGSDTLWVRANDGTVWGAWSRSFSISDPPAVAAGETITLGSAYAGRVDFLADTGMLKLENSSSFAGTVAGLHGQDAIDFADIDFSATSTLGYAANADNSGGTLSVGDGMHTANIALLGSYMASTFVAGSDGHGGTLISEAAQASTQSPIVAQPHA